MTPAAFGQGFLLQLPAESFAVRALLGTVVAAALTAVMLRGERLRGVRARQVAVLLPLAVVAVTAAATLLQEAGAFLPRLWPASANPLADGTLVELADEARQLTLRQGIDLLLFLYLAVVALRLVRRLAGAMALRRLLRRAQPAQPGSGVDRSVRRLAALAAQRPPRVLLLGGCPGGAFAAGYLRPTLVVDPELLAALDDRELEGLLAHELGHLVRRDPTRGLVVGIVHDLVFFLPTVRFAVQWLRVEQEQCADRLAASLTTRPAALASSIMKVWQGAPRGSCALPGGSCAAVPALAGVGRVAWLPNRRRHDGAARIVARRVERLIGDDVPVGEWRRRGELLLVAAALCASSVAGLAVPDWAARRFGPGLAFATIPAAPAVEGETAVWETFRSLTASGPTERTPAPTRTTAECPCVESQAQLRAGEAAQPRPTHPRLLWARGEQEAMHLRSASTYDSVWTGTRGDAEVGVFLLTRGEDDEHAARRDWVGAP